MHKHALNPVDWYLCLRENKPVLVSIGYI
ncbi:thioredoxin domain-containing protein [Bacillus sp. B19-2]|nr:thioredoxin domain-containing protein [Bacillus sp. B19-2]